MIETEGLTGADTLLRVLAHMGVDRIFSSPGSEWSPVWEAFAKAKAQSEGVPLYIRSRPQKVAVRMGNGHTKSPRQQPPAIIHTTRQLFRARGDIQRHAPNMNSTRLQS